jgi:alkylation response protein AidB-like acyl-CoA dehydrogenase
MRFAFSQDQTQMQSALRDVLKKECAPGVVRAAWSGDAGFAPLWKTLADVGVLGLGVPEALGGLGMNELDLVLLLEECGRAAVPAPVVATTAVAVPLLREIANDALNAKWLNAIASGGAIVTTNVGSTSRGSSVAGDVVEYADVAALALLAYRTKDGDDELHAVPRQALTLEPQASVDGARRLFRASWSPGAATCISRGETAKTAIANAFDRGAWATSAELLGLARQMIDMTVDYVKVRKQFGSAIGSFQAVKHHLASALVKVEFARPVVHRAAYAIAHHEADRSTHVSMAKACASDAAMLASRAALQCHGAIGYTVEHDLHMWMKRAWALGASWGDSAWHRARVGNALFGAENSAFGGGRS